MKEQIERELIKMINSLKKGETLHYWYDIADMFDKVKKNGETNYDIVNIYDGILDDLEDKGIIKFKKDEEGNDNIIVKL